MIGKCCSYVNDTFFLKTFINTYLLRKTIQQIVFDFESRIPEDIKVTWVNFMDVRNSKYT